MATTRVVCENVYYYFFLVFFFYHPVEISYNSGYKRGAAREALHADKKFRSPLLRHERRLLSPVVKVQRIYPVDLIPVR